MNNFPYDYTHDFLGWRVTYIPGKTPPATSLIEVAPGMTSKEQFHDTHSFDENPIDCFARITSCPCSPKIGIWNNVSVVVHKTLSGHVLLPGDIYISKELGVFATKDFIKITQS